MTSNGFSLWVGCSMRVSFTMNSLEKRTAPLHHEEQGGDLHLLLKEKLRAFFAGKQVRSDTM